MAPLSEPPGVKVTGAVHERYDEVLSREALEFVADLQRRFGPRRLELLARRHERQSELDAGAELGLLAETAEVRAAHWRVAPPAPGLVDRRVEITGPTDKKMTINALNSGARVWLADFEDANTPLWENMVGGQLNLRDALDSTIGFTAEDGRVYELGEQRATIVARPRGWHLAEKHLLVDGAPVAGCLFDFGLYFFHCHRRQLDGGAGPYFYLPKTESHLEARLWNDVFSHAEAAVGVPTGTVRATVLIETIPAAFEMEEILFELRDHSAGLNAGRWDYLFSIIKKFKTRGAAYVLPNRNDVTMTAPFMRAYCELLVDTCHRRGAHAIGGMAAFIPSRRDREVNDRAMEKVRADKEREVSQGFDGSWVAHPDLVPLCREVFDAVLGERPNQIDRPSSGPGPGAPALTDLAGTGGSVTLEGVRNDVSVGLQYLASWLAGSGAVAVFSLMEDVATAEIARSQIWQWIHNGVVLDDGERLDATIVERVLDEELERIAHAQGDAHDAHAYAAARALFVEVALADDFVDFLTLPAYERLP